MFIDRERLSVFFHQYRKFLYRCFGKPLYGIMSKGFACDVQDPTMNITHGDVLHPCVRFLEEGFEGHKWWMVYTPYYGGNDSLENPRLCYSDNSGQDVPLSWRFYCEIKGKPSVGYNSDPTLMFWEGRLYVFFRENYTEKARSFGCSRATMGCYVLNREVFFIQGPQLIEERRNVDKEVCPAFVSMNKGVRAYSFHIRFCSRIMYRLPQPLSTALYRFLGLLKELCIYDRIQFRGVSIWEADRPEDRFTYRRTVRMKRLGIFTHPWHFDVFRATDRNGIESVFAIIQSDDQYADIRLARSEDGEHFSLFREPLITSDTIGMKGIYKPSAVVVDGKFLLFYTARDNIDRSLNRLFVTKEDWQSILQRLSK